MVGSGVEEVGAGAGVVECVVTGRGACCSGGWGRRSVVGGGRSWFGDGGSRAGSGWSDAGGGV
eukprot:6626515-Prymnesium_polylepis.1